MTELSSLVIISLLFVLAYLFYKLTKIKAENKKILSQKKNSEVVLGQIAEQMAPFLEHFKYDPHKVKFLGQPVDYIYFGDDAIGIIEVKSGKLKLTPKQTLIKNLIKDKKVFWEEVRIPEKLIKPDSTINED